ncbi:amidohydrolase family protein [Elongatibacter sediminis]|uniref:Amidohydrolase family protein n=1 Tax=Elongatibacter sediminis TaxID=3119006 RepID=A0AAW9RCN6_9GAMM
MLIQRIGCVRIRWLAALLLLAVATGSAAEPSAEGLIIVHAGQLLTVPGEPPQERQSVYIRDGRITSIRSGFERAEGATVVDLGEAFVLPGLIDLHVHLTTNPEPGGELDDVTRTGADLALVAAVNAERLLNAGFTTVLDLGTGRREHEEAVFALSDAIEAGRVAGPRVLAVGSPLSIPGQSRTARYRGDIEAVSGPQNVCSGADACRRTVREQVKRGADVISFYNTGSLLSVPSVPMTFTEAEMRAIVETAHALGRPVVADGGNTAGDASGINAALRAGVDSVDTVTYADEETWRLLNKTGAWFVPHLYAVVAAVGDTPQTLEQGSMGWLPRPILEFLFALKQEVPSAVDARKAGVRFAFGSDPGVFPHGENAREFAELVGVGLSPAEAIATATTGAAAMLWREAEIGSLEPGKRADLIAVEGNPLEDVRALERVIWVMKDGRDHGPLR